MNASKVVLLSGPDDAHMPREDVMKFRLTYEGPIEATQGKAIGGQRDPKAKHKHNIRKAFHVQLKQLWSTNKFLKEVTTKEAGIPGERIPLAHYIAGQYRLNPYRFVPLVLDQYFLLCSVDILFLRRDIPGRVIYGGDIDNRLKTVIDALRRPLHPNEVKDIEPPAEGEDPFYCLLEDDKQISHLSVEADTLLDPPLTDEDADYRRARLVITVELRSYYTNWFNLSFS